MKLYLFSILFICSACSLGQKPVIHPNTGAVRTDSGIVVTGTDSTTITLTGNSLLEFEKRINFFDIPLEDYWFDVQIRPPISQVPEPPGDTELFSPELNRIIDSVQNQFTNVPDVVLVGAISGSKIKQEYIEHASHDCFDTQFNIPHTFGDYWTFVVVTEQDGKTLAAEDTLVQAIYR